MIFPFIPSVNLTTGSSAILPLRIRGFPPQGRPWFGFFYGKT